MEICNVVYFWLWIDLMHILPPATAKGYDGSHHPRYAECSCSFFWGDLFKMPEGLIAYAIKIWMKERCDISRLLDLNQYDANWFFLAPTNMEIDMSLQEIV